MLEIYTMGITKQVEYEGPRNGTIPHEINTRYVIKKELGKGAYGTVYLAVDRVSGQQQDLFREIKRRVAIKRIDDVFRTRTDAKRTLREITILRQCDHPNICKLQQKSAVCTLTILVMFLFLQMSSHSSICGQSKY